TGVRIIVVNQGPGAGGEGNSKGNGDTASGGGGNEDGTGIVVLGTGQGKGGAKTGSVGGGSRAGTTQAGGARTSAERIIVLEGRLNEQLARYDGMILAKRDEVIAQDNIEGSTPGDSGSGAGAGAGEGTGAGQGEGEGATASAPLLTTMVNGSNSNSGGGTMPALPGDNRQGEFGNSQVTAEIPADIPNGSDDDVVARQLREAAMKESDPKLRAKLWDEYRKYKQGVISKK
ncbi:MAG: hypothetical protein HW386_518, partial [Gammaproteobacteria bacterium]|nr:hypothetical protein [Gammaproteobacteria bacterium]